jgi:hypothetical protein
LRIVNGLLARWQDVAGAHAALTRNTQKGRREAGLRSARASGKLSTSRSPGRRNDSSRRPARCGS